MRLLPRPAVWSLRQNRFDDALATFIGGAVERVVTNHDDMQAGVFSFALLHVVASGGQIVRRRFTRLDRDLNADFLASRNEVWMIHCFLRRLR